MLAWLSKGTYRVDGVGGVGRFSPRAGTIREGSIGERVEAV
jgi:hypothetical protein